MNIKKNLSILLAFLSAAFLGAPAFAEAVAAPEKAAAPRKPISLQTSQKMRNESKWLVYCMEHGHYLRMPVSELDVREFIREYMQNVDFFKLFFTTGDVQHFQDFFSPSIDVMLRQGTLLPAFSIYDKFLDRADARLQWIKERMKKPFDFTENATFRPDRSKSEWPKDWQAANELWENRLKYDIVNEILSYSAKKHQAEKKAQEKSAAKAQAAESAQVDESAAASQTPATEQTAQAVDADAKSEGAKAESGAESETPAGGEPAPKSVAQTDGESADDAADIAEESEIESEEAEVVREEEKEPKTFEEKLAKAEKEVLTRYEKLIENYRKADAMEIQEIYLNTLSHFYDPHSSFLSEYYLEEFDISVRNALVGIGAMLQDKDGYCVIAELMAGGPAEESKQLSNGDKILAVGQETGEMVDVIGVKLRNTVRMIRGKSGTKVRLLIEPASNPSARKTITLVRREIKLTTKLAKAEIYTVPVGDKTVPVGVIDLPGFYGEGGFNGESKGFSASKDVEELLGKLKAAGVKGIILDMRRNGGGFLPEAVDLAGLFIKKGPVVQVRNAAGRVEKLWDTNSKVVWDGPLIILVSRLSASATEIVAGALQDHKRAIVVGDKSTHGKGTVQAVLNLGNFDPEQKSAAKVTIQKWYTPNGESIQMKGVHPDIVLPSPYDYMEIGEQYKDYALKWDCIEPDEIQELWGYGLPKDEADKLVEKLTKQSVERQKKLEEFAFWNSQIDRVKARWNTKDWSVNLAEREKKLAEDEAFADASKKREKELAALNFKKEKILLESAKENEQAESEKKAQERKAGVMPEDIESELDSEEPPAFDVQLREALRIMADWLSLE